MITVENHGNGFEVRTKFPGMGVRGTKEQVGTIEEACTLIKHHFAQPHEKARCLWCKD